MNKFYILNERKTVMGTKKLYPNPTITFYHKPKGEDKKKKYNLEFRNFVYITDSEEVQDAIESALKKRIESGRMEVKTQDEFMGNSTAKGATHKGGHSTKEEQLKDEVEDSKGRTRKHKKLDEEQKKGV